MKKIFGLLLLISSFAAGQNTFQGANTFGGAVTLQSVASGTAGTDSIIVISSGVLKRIAASYYATSGGGGSVAGNNRNIQFNAGGSFAGNDSLSWAASRLAITGSMRLINTAQPTMFADINVIGSTTLTRAVIRSGTTDKATGLYISPNGTGVASNRNAYLYLFSTDYGADQTNFSGMELKAGADTYTGINMVSAGTGTTRDFNIYIDDTRAVTVNTDRTVKLHNVESGTISDSVLIIDEGIIKKAVLEPVREDIEYVNNADYTFVDGISAAVLSTASADKEFDLPAASSYTGRVLTVRNASAYLITFNYAIQYNSTTGDANLRAGRWVTMQSDGSLWIVIAQGGDAPTSGNYTPTMDTTSLTGTVARTIKPARWWRIGNQVHVEGQVRFTVIITGTKSFTLTLPVPATLVDEADLTGGVWSHGGTTYAIGQVNGSDSGTVAEFSLNCAATEDYIFNYSYSYTIYE